jgi:hypothetical protein
MGSAVPRRDITLVTSIFLPHTRQACYMARNKAVMHRRLTDDPAKKKREYIASANYGIVPSLPRDRPAMCCVE